MKRAKFWGLVGAYSLDFFLICFGGSLLLSSLLLLLLGSKIEQVEVGWEVLAVQLYLYVFCWLYFFIFEGVIGNASPGKMATGICLSKKNLVWWRVLISCLIDAAILPLSMSIALRTQYVWTSRDAVGDGMTGFFISLAGWVLYFSICEHLFRKSLGKKLMGLRVVRKEEIK